MTAAPPIPETRYADSHGVSIAYQVLGSGPRDLVVVPGIVSNLDMNWESDSYARMLRRFADDFRVILFDKRGQGLSDSIEGVPTLDERMDDVRAVMEAAGSATAVILALSEGGAMAALFTATCPARVEKLVMYGTMARFTACPDFPHQPTLEQHMEMVAQSWGKPVSARGFAPSRAHDAAFCDLLARYQRQSASPGAIRRLMIANDQIDVRAILSQIRRPTLIIQRRGDRIVSNANGRYLADHVPGAVYLELPGIDHLPAEGDADAVVDAVARFAAAGRPRAEAEAPGRWLATVLFTDVVGSTQCAVALGDSAWSALLTRLHALQRRELEAQRGREIDSAGDGLFATFDGPARATLCALGIARGARDLGLEIRAGLHTGEVETTGAKVSGVAVHIGARVMAQAGPGEVLVSSTVRDLVAGAGLGFEDRGAHALKGVPGEWRLFRAHAAG